MAKKQLVTIPEASEMLGLAERTVQRMCQEGVLRATKDGIAWKIEKTSVKKVVKDRKRAKK